MPSDVKKIISQSRCAINLKHKKTDVLLDRDQVRIKKIRTIRFKKKKIEFPGSRLTFIKIAAVNYAGTLRVYIGRL